MGTLRFLDSDLAVARRGRVPYAAVEALHRCGHRVLFAPNHPEVEHGSALNIVTLGPRRILMAAGNTVSQEFFEKCGIVCHTVEVNELIKAAGGIGCLTGILQRDTEKRLERTQRATS